MDRFAEMEAEAVKKYEAEISAAKGRLDRVLAAIKVLREEFPSEGVPGFDSARAPRRTKFPPPDQTQGATARAHGESTQKVKGALQYVPEIFDHSDVSKVIEQQWPDSAIEPRTVRETLRRLEQSGEIQAHMVGEGRRATTYKKPNTTQVDNSEFEVQQGGEKESGGDSKKSY